MSVFRVLSWGVGTQSTALAAMSAVGAFDLPKLDVVITADTGWERQATYTARRFYEKWLAERGCRVEVVSAGNIRQEGSEEHIHIPFFTETGAPLRRQCTRHFKIRPIRRRVRELLGYPASTPPHPPAGAVEQWLGISLDEYQRMKSSRVAFVKHRFPLVELRLTRQDCIDWLEAQGLPVPIKSACVGCPFRVASEWVTMQQDSPAEWQDAVSFDGENPLAARAGSSADRLYLWRGSLPLTQVNWETEVQKEQQQESQWIQIPMFIECDSGYCHV